MKIKKLALALLVCCTSSMLYAQTTDSLISQKRIGSLNCSYSKISRKGNIYFGVTISFQNASYSHITDMAYITFLDSVSHAQFIDDLSKTLLLTSKTTTVFERERYRMGKHQGFASPFLTDNQSRMAIINNKQIEKLIAWLRNTKATL